MTAGVYVNLLEGKKLKQYGYEQASLDMDCSVHIQSLLIFDPVCFDEHMCIIIYFPACLPMPCGGTASKPEGRQWNGIRTYDIDTSP